jgi:hypothetical protein
MQGGIAAKDRQNSWISAVFYAAGILSIPTASCQLCLSFSLKCGVSVSQCLTPPRLGSPLLGALRAVAFPRRQPLQHGLDQLALVVRGDLAQHHRLNEGVLLHDKADERVAVDRDPPRARPAASRPSPVASSRSDPTVGVPIFIRLGPRLINLDNVTVLNLDSEGDVVFEFCAAAPYSPSMDEAQEPAPLLEVVQGSDAEVLRRYFSDESRFPDIRKG